MGSALVMLGDSFVKFAANFMLEIHKFTFFCPPDADKKVERILKLIKRRNRGKKDQELVGLVEDFHKQYQLLYAQYDHLIRQPGKQASEGNGNGNGNESCSFHASSSDSEYYSSEDVEINTALSNNRSSFRRTATNMGEELKKAYAEVADLKHQLASRKKEKEALDSDHGAALSKIQETETMNADLRNEMDGLEKRLFALGTVPKGQVAEQLAGLITELCGKLAELEQQRETNKALLVHISEEGVTERMEQIKDNENNLTSKIEDSMARVSNLKNEVDYLRSQKCESFDEVNIMKQELESVRSQNTELEMVLERKSTEVSQYLIQVKTLKEELARKSGVEQIMAEEKEGLQVQVMDLESEVDALRKQKNKSEDEVKSKLGEINHLREEKGQLNARILELETLYRERSLEEDSNCERANETAKMKVEVNLLQPKLDSLKEEQSSLECQITNQQTTTKEKDDNKSMPPKTRLVRRLSLGNITNLNYHNLEMKMEDLAVEFGKKIDDGIRLLYQRIKVAERIQHENTQIFKLTRERLQQEIETLYLDNEALQQRVGTLDYELRTLRDTMEAEKAAMAGLNAMVDKLEDERNYLTPISNVTDEGVSVIDECEQAKSNVEILVAEMQKENEEELLGEKVMSLEAKLSEEGEDKLKMLKEIRELEQKMREMHEENELLRERVMNLKAKLSEEGEEKLKALKAMSELEKLSKEKDEILSDLLALIVGARQTLEDQSARSMKSRTQEGLISVASERKCQKSIVTREKVQSTGRAIDCLVHHVDPKKDEQLKGSKLDYLASLSKVREAEEIIRKLKRESERTERRKSKLVVENEVFRHKPESAAKMEAEKKDMAVKKIEDGEEFEDLGREIDWLKEEKLTLKQELENVWNLNAASEENKSLNSKLLEVSDEVQQACKKWLESRIKNVQSNHQIVADLEQIIEDLKRDLEIKGDDLSTLVENVHTIEVKLCLSNQKLRVTEQLLTENEESLKKAEAKKDQNTHSRMITDISENVKAVIHKFEHGYGNYDHHVEETSKELRIAKRWNKNINCKRELRSYIKENKEEEKNNLLKAIKHLVKRWLAKKEKDQGILGLREEEGIH
ncbi:hypothetical protein CXB51_019414 [Gossypium anomalum]|uniref:NAB domain-containing protein n=1 Tax=Gossypium anomalum TaxID=47600 RepID=A0A8J5YNV8_9ROSI|nr:hypothetical protein CXB51_019414 [Gossypium anomalum]